MKIVTTNEAINLIFDALDTVQNEIILIEEGKRAFDNKENALKGLKTTEANILKMLASIEEKGITKDFSEKWNRYVAKNMANYKKHIKGK